MLSPNLYKTENKPGEWKIKKALVHDATHYYYVNDYVCSKCGFVFCETPTVCPNCKSPMNPFDESESCFQKNN